MSEDSYIFWDDATDEEERKILFQCAECYSENRRGYLWSARNGYGCYDIYCAQCKRLIHDKADGISLV